jgi:hypothetical protein
MELGFIQWQISSLERWLAGYHKKLGRADMGFGAHQRSRNGVGGLWAHGA